MPKRPLADQLDNVVEALLVSLRPRPEEKPHRDLAALLRVATALRNLPREDFRATLKKQLQGRTAMNEGTKPSATAVATQKTGQYMRPGLTSITPYVVINQAAEFIEFLKAAFGAVERLRVPTESGSIMHAELEIGNGAIEVADAGDQFPASPTDIHLYVDDADATYTSAASRRHFHLPADRRTSFGRPLGRGQRPIWEQLGHRNPEGLDSRSRRNSLRTTILASPRSRQDDPVHGDRIRCGGIGYAQIPRRNGIARHHAHRKRYIGD